MKLVDKIQEDMLTAMRGNDTARTAVLRLLKSSLKNEQIKAGHELSDDEAMKVLAREVKQRRESIDIYTKGGRGDLATAEEEEMAIIAEYLPEQMSLEELEKIVDQVMAETNATTMQQMGMVIGRVMTLAEGRIDGAAVSSMVKTKLLG
jgi:uncharacterized protein YqeY